MGLFRRKLSLTDRFPIDRLSVLPLVVFGGVERCISEKKLDRDAVWKSRFIGGYLVGYTDYLDGIDERFGAGIIAMLFKNAYPGSDTEMFRKTAGYLLIDDEQTKRGFGAGVPDGRRYFSALESKTNATGATDSLSAMFDIGSVDIGQQLI